MLDRLPRNNDELKESFRKEVIMNYCNGMEENTASTFCNPCPYEYNCTKCKEETDELARKSHEVIRLCDIAREKNVETKAIPQDVLEKTIAFIYGLLKKQEAKKPERKDKVGGNCPVCGLRMAKGDKYCCQCGTLMDWE